MNEKSDLTSGVSVRGLQFQVFRAEFAQIDSAGHSHQGLAYWDMSLLSGDPSLSINGQ